VPKYNNKRVTIEDVAREAGVSAMTVSRVINNKGEINHATRSRIKRIIHDMGYRPSRVARSLATNRTFILGVMVPDITNPFFSEFVGGVENVAWEAGYNVLLCNTQEQVQREQAVLQLFEESQVDGVLVCSARLSDEELIPLLEQHNAVVVFNRPIASEVAGIVRMNDKQGTVQAVNHLMDSGRTRIGLIAGLAASMSGQARLQGFAEAHQAAGSRHQLRVEHVTVPNSEGAYRATKALLTAYPDTNGLVCYNDLFAVGALRACRDLNKRVPDDIAVVGCDDIPLASLVSPALTTLRVNQGEMGGQAVSMLLERIQGQHERDEFVFQQELVIRESAP